MRLAELASRTGYRKRRYYGGGKPSVASPNYLERQFIVPTPNRHWVSDTIYIRAHEGWLYLAVVLDLFSRRVIGWSMGGRMTAELVMDALLMAIWRRKPTSEVLIHSDQGSQYTSERCQHFMEPHNLKSSMSRRGNCHDNAVAESFFQLQNRDVQRNGSIKTGKKRRRISLIMWRCFIMLNAATVPVSINPLQFMKVPGS